MSTEGSENDEGSDSQSAGQNDLLQNARNDLTNQHQQQQAQQQQQTQQQQQQQQQPPPPQQPQTNMIKQQSVSTPSPASSSPPTQLTMTPSPSSGAAQQQQQSLQQQQQQNLQQQQNSNNMTSLPPISTPMSLSHAISTQAASAFMANYSQHSAFGTNFGHPGTPGNTTQGANYNQAHSGNMAPGASPYLPSGAGGTYSQLPGHYSWN